MKGVNSVIQQTEYVAEILSRSREHFGDLESELISLAENINPDNPNIDSVESIRGLCHIKILGDINVSLLNVTHKEWSVTISKLEQKCSQLIRRIQKNA